MALCSNLTAQRKILLQCHRTSEESYFDLILLEQAKQSPNARSPAIFPLGFGLQTARLGRLARRAPGPLVKSMLTGKSLFYIGTPKRAREFFFSAGVSDADVERYSALLCDESQRVTSDAMFLDLPKPQRISTPMLVLGGELDNCFSQKEIHATARAYRTQAEIFPGMAHNMMLEPGWQAVAERIDGWLAGRGL